MRRPTKPMIRRAALIALFVGPTLVAINQGDVILNGGDPNIWKVCLTMMVPFCVSMFSAMSVKEVPVQ
jgi:hypothetical protein